MDQTYPHKMASYLHQFEVEHSFKMLKTIRWYSRGLNDVLFEFWNVYHLDIVIKL